MRPPTELKAEHVSLGASILGGRPFSFRPRLFSLLFLLLFLDLSHFPSL